MVPLEQVAVRLVKSRVGLHELRYPFIQWLVLQPFGLNSLNGGVQRVPVGKEVAAFGYPAVPQCHVISQHRSPRRVALDCEDKGWNAVDVIDLAAVELLDAIARAIARALPIIGPPANTLLSPSGKPPQFSII